MTNPLLIAQSRALAKIALASAVVLVVLVLLLPLFINHATVSDAFLILWGLFLLLAAIILGVSLAYVFLTRGLREGAQLVVEESRFPPGPDRSVAEPMPTAGPGESGLPEIALRLLTGDERSLYRRIVQAGGVVLQKDLVDTKLFSGSKVTRLLDRLETKGLIGRERYGMTNRIRLSEAWREKP